MRLKSMTTLCLTGMLLFCVGCLDKEVEELLYIEPDGSLTWTVLEYDVHSGEKDEQERLAEESAYLERAQRGEAAAAVALERIGATQVQTVVLRDRSPYSIRVEGRFTDPAAAFRGLFESCGTAAQVSLQRHRDGRHELRLKIDLEAMIDCGDSDESEASVLGSLLSGGEPALHLVAGRFLEADGFELDDDARVARLLDGDEPADGLTAERTTWRLVWDTDAE